MKQNKANNIKLSIGMIVKNEEKHLRNCLEALKPLMTQVKCELIIADTGSTDSTVQIAKEFTNHVFNFEWCGDFSAARNATLDRAKGEWYMFLDADEYFVDLKKLIDFLNTKEQKQYNTATYIIRNFVDANHSVYQDIRGVRLCRRLPTTKFLGIIHEALIRVMPVKHIEAIALHYGYAYKTDEEKSQKNKRNMELLMKEYSENPNDPRTIIHICDVCEDEDRLKYLLEGRELVKDDGQHFFFGGIYTRLIKHYSGIGMHSEAVKVAEEYFTARPNTNSCMDLDMRVFQAWAYLSTSKLEEASIALENYFELYEKYQNGTIDLSDSITSVTQFASSKAWHEQLKNAINAYAALGKYDKAFEAMCKYNFAELSIDLYFSFIGDLHSLVTKSKQYDKFYEIFTKIQHIPDKRQQFLNELEKYYIANSNVRKEIAKPFAASKPEPNDEFLRFLKLTAMESASQDFFQQLDVFVANLHNLKEPKSFYSDIIYWAIKYKRDVTPLANNFTKEEIDAQLVVVAATYNDFAELMLAFTVPEEFCNSIKALSWLVSALEKAVLTKDNLNNKTFQLALSFKFAERIIQYVTRIYNPNLLNEENITVLPQIHRFGFFLATAQANLVAGNGLAYVQYLRKAFKSCEPLKDVISLMLDNFKENIAN